MTAFRVTRAAQADIKKIGRYTEEHWGPAQRRLYLNGLNERFAVLAASPTIAAERRNFAPPVRIHPYEKHLIVYIIEDGGIVIVRVLHQSMDISGQLSVL